MDMSKAFDTLDHSILIAKLRYYGLQTDAANLLQSYLENRDQYVDYGGVESKHELVRTGIDPARLSTWSTSFHHIYKRQFSE
jgi:hypothetical protein